MTMPTMINGQYEDDGDLKRKKYNKIKALPIK